MTKKSFSKTLSANDVGKTGTHQAGILVPKTAQELLEFLPPLDSSIKNPDAWIQCVDENGNERSFRFVYYNNKLHDEGGTRNEYRLTHMTGYFKEMRAVAGDSVHLTRDERDMGYAIRLVKHTHSAAQPAEGPVRIRITSGWRRVH